MRTTLHEIPALRTTLAAARKAGQRIALVPTMGNLHAGHVRLAEVAAKECDLVVVSIFVNPLQFGPNEDFDSYPRTLAADLEQLAAIPGLVFAPSVATMYPTGPCATRIRVTGLDNILCGAARPGHFDGVGTVVSKLLNIVQPDTAYFGQKDYQQLTLIRTMVRDLDMPVTITGVATERAPDGLALSSRNGYLTPEQRQLAPVLHSTLVWLGEQVQKQFQGKGAGQAQEASPTNSRAGLLDAACARLMAAGFERPDYVSIRRRSDLAEAGPDDVALVLLAAARLGKARLIDNIAIDLTH